MNSFILVLSCFAALAAASPTSDIVVEYFGVGRTNCRVNCHRNRPWMPTADCPTVPCPPPNRDGQCGAPDCTNPGNRYVLHPHWDPNFYYQCVHANAIGGVEAKTMACACGTLFTLSVDPPRCVHPWEWQTSCPGWQVDVPVLNEDNCSRECPSCVVGEVGDANNRVININRDTQINRDININRDITITRDQDRNIVINRDININRRQPFEAEAEE